ncbi:lipopolysaccharide biosynthesis protein [Ideonella paludis]|uniref:Polysaccharide biosynthesis C-terminal domain-containing protein n=1 Tax=Ideonella paludis TaxID=1233411 RepID=A0ABS5E1C9_9BURK|nr:polysaccharide biosynthesis C-terminal domain-containing protein [Ideonella paludis]MBQ0937188.1 polysaccharide biosynthesis C-terminal domain-containing protein [Ideonella paludis]
MKKPSTLWSALGSAVFLRLIMAVVNFGQFWVFTRMLPADELGGYSLILGVLMMLHAMPLLGLSVPLIRRIATGPEDASREVSNAFALSLPMAVLITIGVYVYGVTQFDAALHGPLDCLALTMIPVAWILVAECALLGLERMDLITKVQGLEAVGRLVFGVAAIQLGYGLYGVFVCIFVLRALVAVYYALSSVVPRVRWALVSWDIQVRNFREIPTFIGIVILAALVLRVDVLVLEHTRDLAEVALFAAGARLYEAALMVPTMAAQALMPTLARMLQESEEKFKQMFREVLDHLMLIGGLFAIGLAALAGVAVALVYPSHLQGAGEVFSWLALGTVLVMVDQLLSSAMLAAKAQREDMRSLAVAAVVLVLALLLLTGPWGAQGAAWAILIAHLTRLAMRIRWAAARLAFPELPGASVRHLFGMTMGMLGLRLVHLQHPAAEPVWALMAGLAAWYMTARLTGVLRPGWWRRLRQWRASLQAAR